MVLIMLVIIMKLIIKAVLVWGAIGLEFQVSDKLMKLHMSGGGKADVLGYNLAFADLAQKINWSNFIIMYRYLDGLHPIVRDGLGSYSMEE